MFRMPIRLKVVCFPHPLDAQEDLYPLETLAKELYMYGSGCGGLATVLLGAAALCISMLFHN